MKKILQMVITAGMVLSMSNVNAKSGKSVWAAVAGTLFDYARAISDAVDDEKTLFVH